MNQDHARFGGTQNAEENLDKIYMKNNQTIQKNECLEMAGGRASHCTHFFSNRAGGFHEQIKFM